jgi:hypothetical protein
MSVQCSLVNTPVSSSARQPLLQCSHVPLNNSCVVVPMLPVITRDYFAGVIALTDGLILMPARGLGGFGILKMVGTAL